jgi:glyoxylase-like metal-dependent hydrolase (beta-lactamase superfamily II)
MIGPMTPDARRQPARHDPSAPAAARCVIEAFPLGPFETNCYLVYVPDAPGPRRPCWIVDASFEPAPLIDRVRELSLTPQALLLTHAHVDHIAGVDEVLDAFPGTPVLIHAAEKDWLSSPILNLAIGVGLRTTARGPTGFLEEGQVLELSGTRWTVLHTPGHSPGGITLHNEAERTALVGDTLFAGSIGRTDFPGSNPDLLVRSIGKKLYTLPDDTTIYPGHGPTSTIGHEKRTNPFVRA